jgi:protein FRA10AC1
MINIYRIGLRWCNKKDILSGKGKKICGNSSCEKIENLTAYEVNMNYVEKDEHKNALVKVYLCKKCGKRLKKMHKIRRKNEKQEKKEKSCPNYNNIK